MGTFNSVLEADFDTIKRNFRLACMKHNLMFNEDIFIDTYIKCVIALQDKDMTNISHISYFWTAYANNLRKSQRVSKFKPKSCVITDIHSATTEYEEDFKDLLYDIIQIAVDSKFGTGVTNIWKLHFIDNKTYEELELMGYEGINFHNLFRQINFYIKNILPKENEVFKKLLLQMSLYKCKNRRNFVYFFLILIYCF